MFYLEKFSNDEVEHIDELSSKNESHFLNYLSTIDGKLPISSGFEVLKTHRITANIATMPSRFESLLETIESIKSQFDEVRIYLNNYDFVPNELSRFTTFIGDDLTDNGKFFWSNNKNEYYFTLDDDIIYPPDYVEKTLPLIGNRIISYHGRRLTGKNKSYYGGHKVYLFDASLDREITLDVLGTGVSAFDTNHFSPHLWKSANYRMTDLLISLEAHIHKIKIISPKKIQNWIKSKPPQSDSIFLNSQGLDTHTKWADMIQSLSEFSLNLETINYEYDDNSIFELSKFIKNLEINRIVNLRSGNGSLVEKISSETNLENFRAYDTENDRVEKSKEFYKTSNFQYTQNLFNVDLHSLKNIILLDDFHLSKKLSTKIFDRMSIGSYLICHNQPLLNIKPVVKIPVKIKSNSNQYFFLVYWK